jgi:hypothetical protein
MVTLLLENKSPLNATDVAGYTPLHHGEKLLYSRDRKSDWFGFLERTSAFLNQPPPKKSKLTHNLVPATS